MVSINQRGHEVADGAIPRKKLKKPSRTPEEVSQIKKQYEQKRSRSFKLQWATDRPWLRYDEILLFVVSSTRVTRLAKRRDKMLDEVKKQMRKDDFIKQIELNEVAKRREKTEERRIEQMQLKHAENLARQRDKMLDAVNKKQMYKEALIKQMELNEVAERKRKVEERRLEQIHNKHTEDLAKQRDKIIEDLEGKAREKQMHQEALIKQMKLNEVEKRKRKEEERRLEQMEVRNVENLAKQRDKMLDEVNKQQMYKEALFKQMELKEVGERKRKAEERRLEQMQIKQAEDSAKQREKMLDAVNKQQMHKEALFKQMELKEVAERKQEAEERRLEQIVIKFAEDLGKQRDKLEKEEKVRRQQVYKTALVKQIISRVMQRRSDGLPRTLDTLIIVNQLQHHPTADLAVRKRVSSAPVQSTFYVPTPPKTPKPFCESSPAPVQSTFYVPTPPKTPKPFCESSNRARRRPLSSVSTESFNSARLGSPYSVATESSNSARRRPPSSVTTESSNSARLRPPSSVATESSNSARLRPPSSVATESSNSARRRPLSSVATESSNSARLSSPSSVADSYFIISSFFH